MVCIVSLQRKLKDLAANKYEDIPDTFPATLLYILPASQHPHRTSLEQLLESTVEWGADVGDVLPEIDGGDGALGDAFWGELELL